MIHFEEVSDEQLLAMHKRADLLNPTHPADVEFHHRVSTEMLARGIEHGHDGDQWAVAVIELDSSVDPFTEATVEMPESVVAEVAKELGSPDWVRQTRLLTVDGMSIRLDTVHKSEIPVAKADGWTPPADVRAAARQAVQWIEDGRAGDGFTAVGRNRARQLADGDTVSQADAVKMRAYFARHFVDKDAEDWGDKSNPTPGMVAWYAWGGDAGRAWVNRLLSEVSKAAYPMGDEEDLFDIGEDPETTPQRDGSLVSMMQILLMDVVTFYLTAHGFHWNVVGKNFQQFHELFGEIYEDALGSIDPLAENIRKLDAFAPFRLSQFVEQRDAVEVDIEYGDGMPLASALYDANEHIIDCFMVMFDKANTERQQGVANFLADRIDAHQKWRWQLRSTLAEYDDAMYEQEMALLETLSPDDLEMFRRIAAALEAGEDPDEFVGKARGNAEVLRDYWRKDPKGKVGWGGGGDWTRCVAAVGKYMSSEEAKGYCALRHKEVNGFYPGDKRNRTQKSASPMLKHPGHPDQKVHAGGKTGLAKEISAAEWREVTGALNKRAASISYNESYANGVDRLNNGDDIEGRVQRQRELLASDLKQFRAEPRGSWVRQSIANNIVDRQGFIDGATGAKRRIRRTLFDSDVYYLAALGGGGAHEFAKEADAEPMVKHPGHPDQKVHAGGKGSYRETRERRGRAIREGKIAGLRRDKDGKVICPEATGGYKAGIPERVDFIDPLTKDVVTLTPEHGLWHHLESDGKGGYRVTKERQKLHAQIVAQATAGVPKSNDPRFVMLGGGPAAGKTSTLVKAGLGNVPGKDKAVHINADDIKDSLPEYGRMKTSNDDGDFFQAAHFAHEESSYLAKLVQQRAQRNQQDIVLDGTGDSKPEKLLKKVSEARRAGYKVDAVYATVPTDVAWARAQRRSLKKSERRYVPFGIVSGTHADVSRVLPQAMELGMFDSVKLYDTSGREGKLLAETVGSGSRAQTTIHDAKGWNAFVSKAGPGSQVHMVDGEGQAWR